MTKHYRMPVLLIEFDRDKAFALQVHLQNPCPGQNGRHCCPADAVGLFQALEPVLRQPSPDALWSQG